MGLLKISLARIYWVIFFMLVFLLTSQAIAQDKVVVIPLFGDEQQTLSAPAPVEKTGQTVSYATGDDGDLKKGVAWPNPRFTDNGDGTVTDNLTRLIWLKNANCFGYETWADALSDCNGLASGSCGLTDGSSAGDWRLPNLKELRSLIDLGNHSPALPSGHPFTNVQSSVLWSSTSTWSSTDAWLVDMNYGYIASTDKGDGVYLWPVRGGN